MRESDEDRETLDLSIVILTRNEEKLIKDCIESVIESVKNATDKKIIETREIILVDSASTDKTIEIAKNYPIKIIQLKSFWHLSAGAGAHIGLLNAKGRKFCIIDGDCIIDKNWFICANPYINRTDVGGLQGITEEVLTGNSKLHKNIIQSINSETLSKHFMEKNKHSEILFKKITQDNDRLSKGYSNATFYLKTEIARKAGGYNPYLCAAEDTEMERQIEAFGYKIIWIPCLMGKHYMGDLTGKITYLQMFKTIWRNSKGLGQVVHYNKKNKMAVKYYVKRIFNSSIIKFDIIFMVFLFYLGLNYFLVSRYTEPMIFLGLLLIFIFLFKCICKKDYLFNFIYGLIFAFVRQSGFIVGYLKKVLEINSYPKDILIIK